MSRLLELQSQLARHILLKQEMETPADSLVVHNGIPGERRLQIYRNNVYSSLIDALRTLYLGTEKLLGENFFRTAAHHYCRAYPSGSGNLHDYGAEFPEFLAEYPAAAGMPYLPDFARLEWAGHRAFHAPDCTTMDFSALNAVPRQHQGEIIFHLNPALHLLASPYPLLDIMKLTSAENENEHVDLDAGGVYLVIVRRNLEVVFEPLTLDEWRFLERVEPGLPFQQICSEMAEIQRGTTVVDMLPAFVTKQYITHFTVEGRE